MPSYDRPVDAKLHVHLANGEIFEAGAEDLEKFGYVKRQDVFGLMYLRILEVFENAGLINPDYGDLSDWQIAPLLNFFTTVVNRPDLLDHWENEAMYVEMANIERRLRDLRQVPVPTYEELREKKDRANK